LLFVEAFKQVFREQYSLDIIRQSVNDIDIHIGELNELIDEETSFLLPEVLVLFKLIKEDHRKMIESLKIPLQELCDYADGSETEIDNTIAHGLNLVHQQLIKLIDTIENNFLSHITPWENAMLMNKESEDQFRWYVSLVGTILLVLTIVFGLVPIVFIIIIIVCSWYHYQRKNSPARYRLVNRKIIHFCEFTCNPSVISFSFDLSLSAYVQIRALENSSKSVHFDRANICE
jgi:hypothetical protein